MVTCYWLDSLGIEFQWGQNFLHPSRPVRETTQPPIQLVRGILGEKRTGSGADHTPQYSAEVKERVKLYLYSPSETSWPVLGRIYLLAEEVILHNLVQITRNVHLNLSTLLRPCTQLFICHYSPTYIYCTLSRKCLYHLYKIQS
jgi:hypothetical protein